MLARAAVVLPVGPGWWYEPKWDGFRCLVFRDGDDLVLQSRNGRPLQRYFPELAGPLRAGLPRRVVLDGELVVMTDAGLDFDALSARIHPAASRVARLAEEQPAAFVAFDLLADGVDRRSEPTARRRGRLTRALAGAAPPVHRTPGTADASLAADWFDRFEGAGLDGVVAKGDGEPYRPGERGWVKVRHRRHADCVVGGWRADDHGAASLLLGLHDAAGRLHHVGVASGFDRRLRARLAEELAPLALGPDADHPWLGDGPAAPFTRRPGGPSRWRAGPAAQWRPVRPERVVEVAYDHLQAGRFRHTARFVRWRPDRDPTECTFAQLEVPVPAELRAALGR
jgi:ATP-dependent DNA ligase